ncbi:polysaccharide pyruvyl transferase family protein [Gryllotalpicola koreensis]|uniref:Polysaccharide pyruvyl transferase family protein n=1 Tax=Gryllotalpicola koreensis TaxID=993086 RepID=A0ABP8A0E6_9MICO
MHGVTVFSWNPHRPLIPGRRGSRLVVPRRIGNFGDLLGPVIVAALLERASGGRLAPQPAGRRVLAVGSVVQFAAPGDVVWGSGLNGKSLQVMGALPDVDVRAVRGPRTREVLAAHDINAPEVYGDPALLAPLLFPWLREAARDKVRGTLLAPNMNDRRALRGRRDVLDPQRPLAECLLEIARSERVVGSSLHAVIVAESLGIPAVAVGSSEEHPFKYDDYYSGTGRPGIRLADSVDHALAARAAVPGPEWDPEPLLRAFPFDVWGAAAPAPAHEAHPAPAPRAAS